jgi:hypothetical protein
MLRRQTLREFPETAPEGTDAPPPSAAVPT